jgi:hypothetical protein
MEAHEHYDRQHQDLREEVGRIYGDRIEYVDFEYATKLTAVNVLALAHLAVSPPPPRQVMIGGAVTAHTQLTWTPADGQVKGYKIYWRDTTSPNWQYSRYVGDVTEATLENVCIDNYLFGVASVSHVMVESPVQFPVTLIPRTQK